MPWPRLVARRPAALAARAGAAVAVLVALAVVGGGVTGASAALPIHARLTSSTPADGSRVGTVTEVVLGFSEEINPSFVAVTVTGPGGGEAVGDPRVDGRTVTQTLSPTLAAGEHVTTFKVVSADGHPVSGTVTFTTTRSAAPGEPSESPTEPSPTPSPTGSPAAAGPAASAPSASAAGEPASSEYASRTPWAVAGVGDLLLAVLRVGTLRRSRRGSTRDPQTGDSEAS